MSANNKQEVPVSIETNKMMAELQLRRAQMARLPFCPDHRDKVRHLPCRECEVEHLRSLLLAAKSLILAAKGPSGGPESWDDTRDRWMWYVDELEKREPKPYLHKEKDQT